MPGILVVSRRNELVTGTVTSSSQSRSVFFLLAVLIGTLFLGCGVRAQQTPLTERRSNNNVATSESAPGAVTLDGKQLFVICTNLGPYTPASRAHNIIKRLDRLVADPDFDPGSVSSVNTESSTDIVAGDIILVSVTDADAKIVGRNRQELAQQYIDVLKSALADHKAKRSLSGALENASPYGFGKALQHLLLEPLSLKFIIIVAGTLIISLLVRLFQRSLGNYVRDSSSRYASRKVVTFIGYFLVFILSIVVFKDELGNLAVIVGAATAGIAFALKEVIVSLAGWVAVTFGDFYKIGDRIQLGGIKGDVIDIGFARTTLMELGEWVKADQYTGRIVRVANSFVFTEPMFNYSGDFPYLWDEITVPIKYGSDFQEADHLLKMVVAEVTSPYVSEAQEHWGKFEKKYLVERARTEPMVTLVLNDNWMEFTIRYVVEFKKRRLTKDALYRRILEELDGTNGRVGLASATFHLVEAPTINVRVRADDSTTDSKGV